VHPYLAALLPSQPPLQQQQQQPLSPSLVTVLLFDPVDKVMLVLSAFICYVIVTCVMVTVFISYVIATCVMVTASVILPSAS
jgi:hypothetical protein